MTEPLLSFQKMTYQWPDASLPLFRNLNAEVLPGEARLLEGASGSGKSTLLRLAAGTLKPTAGCVCRGTRRLGFVFQDQRLLPWLSVRDNLRFVLRKPREAEISRMLQAVGLADKSERNASELSGGEAQRVNLLRALLTEPELLLLDEPFNGLDLPMAERCAALVRAWKVASPGRGMVLVTHLPQFAPMLGASPWHF